MSTAEMLVYLIKKGRLKQEQVAAKYRPEVKKLLEEKVTK